MIAIKLNANLKVKTGNGKRYRIFQKGTIFRGKTIDDLPEWLIDEIKYFKSKAACDTLIISETQEKAAPIDSNTEHFKASDDKTVIVEPVSDIPSIGDKRKSINAETVVDQEAEKKAEAKAKKKAKKEADKKVKNTQEDVPKLARRKKK